MAEPEQAEQVVTASNDQDVSGSVAYGGGEQITGKPVEPHWSDVFGEQAQGLDQYKSPQDFLNTFNEAQKYMGQSIRIPTGEAGEEQMQKFYEHLERVQGVARVPGIDDDPEVYEQFYSKLGRPQDVSGYQFETPEGLELDAGSEQGYKEVVHRAGLNNKQAGEIHEWLANNIAEEQQAMQQEVEQGMNALKQEWGQAFDHKMEVARGAVKHLTGDDFLEYLDNSGLGNHPAMIKAFASLGEQLGEPESESKQSPSYKTPADLEMEINDIMQRPEYWDGDMTLVSKVQELTRLKNQRI